MSTAFRVNICALAIGIVLEVPVFAWADECSDASNRYILVVRDVEAAMQRFANCISNSRGRDDCSREVSGLRSTQDDFQSAVSRYRRECSN